MRYLRTINLAIGTQTAIHHFLIAGAGAAIPVGKIPVPRNWRTGRRPTDCGHEWRSRRRSRYLSSPQRALDGAQRRARQRSYGRWGRADAHGDVIVTIRKVQTRLAVLHHHGDDLVEMEETYRDRDQVPINETAFVIYLCPRCETVVTVGAITTEVEMPLPPDSPGVR
jgi:hypothetical protein